MYQYAFYLWVIKSHKFTYLAMQKIRLEIGCQGWLWPYFLLKHMVESIC